MKRTLSLLLVTGLAVLSFCACNGAPEVSAQPQVLALSATPVPTPPPTPTPTPSPAPTPVPTPTPPLHGLVIGIDPGHQRVYNPEPEPIAPGSSTTKQKTAGGARGATTGVLEYEVNLAVGLLVRDRLASLGATVYLTRDSNDVDLSNRERAEFFNEHEVDLALRLHCNGSDNKKLHGAFMIIPAKHRTEHYDTCRAAAICIIEEYCRATGLQECYLDNDGLSERGDQTGFNWCTRPIVAIEMGFLTHAEDEQRLADPAFHATMADGLCDGIVRWYTGLADTAGS